MPKWDDVDNPREEEKLITVNEFVRQTRMGKSTVRGLIAAGTIPVVRIGGSVRIRQSVLHAYLTPHKQETPPGYKPRKLKNPDG